ncbi:MAG TPA: hypothetical protein VFR90_00935 [Methylibium sp.]|uniref:hypothetical protein n=1 Tax=Methylibium sp. TaxID=2067992 RepID=UPI002DC0599B|nr:hypothetical protein [Methylibium sp.]HEU4457670.1 hypothetical protein [Methylibium sp.]
MNRPGAASIAAPPRLPSRGRREQVPCSIELAHTADDCHAHVVLEGCEVGPGDEVLVHGAPTQIAWGSRRVVAASATVSRASWLGRLWTRIAARFELGLLYEVSFTSQRFPARSPRPSSSSRSPS